MTLSEVIKAAKTLDLYIMTADMETKIAMTMNKKGGATIVGFETLIDTAEDMAKIKADCYDNTKG